MVQKPLIERVYKHQKEERTAEYSEVCICDLHSCVIIIKICDHIKELTLTYRL